MHLFDVRHYLGNLSRKSCIVLCLRIPQLLVQPFLPLQLLVPAALNHLPLVKHEDILAETAGGKTVGNIDRSLVSDHLVKSGIHFALRLRVGVRRSARP